MSDPVIPFAEAREALSLTPPPGAKARVLTAIRGTRAERARRPLRLPAIAFALLVSTTAAAVGGPPFVRWSTRALGVHTERHRPSPVAPSAEKQARARGTPGAARLVAEAPAEGALPPPASPAAPVEAPTTEVLSPDGKRRTASAPGTPGDPSADRARDSALAEEVAAYHEAAALIASSPGLAIVRLRAHRERFPKSVLGEEVSLRLVQAFGALGRDADARREAQSFVVRYPHSAKYRELRAIADGARVRRPDE